MRIRLELQWPQNYSSFFKLGTYNSRLLLASSYFPHHLIGWWKPLRVLRSLLLCLNVHSLSLGGTVRGERRGRSVPRILDMPPITPGHCIRHFIPHYVQVQQTKHHLWFICPTESSDLWCCEEEAPTQPLDCVLLWLTVSVKRQDNIKRTGIKRNKAVQTK